MTQPASVFADGNVSVLWVPVVEQDNPALSDLVDASVLDLTCYLTDEGWDPNLSEDAATDNRLCSTQNFQGPGRVTTDMPLIYVSNPDSPSDDEAALTLTEGSVGYLVDRRGVPYTQAYAAGDIVTIYKVKLGVQKDGKPTANSPLVIMQNAYLQIPGRSWRVTVTAS